MGSIAANGLKAGSQTLRERTLRVAALGEDVKANPLEVVDLTRAVRDVVAGSKGAPDEVGQGTHLSAAVGEGPPWEVVRVGVETSGRAAQSEKAAQAVEWALDRRGNLHFDLISLPPVEVGEAVENSIRRAIEAGVTVVVADSSTSESTMPGDAATALLIGHSVGGRLSPAFDLSLLPRLEPWKMDEAASRSVREAFDRGSRDEFSLNLEPVVTLEYLLARGPG